jgi:hypothetical protein
MRHAPGSEQTGQAGRSVIRKDNLQRSAQAHSLDPKLTAPECSHSTREKRADGA